MTGRAKRNTFAARLFLAVWMMVATILPMINLVCLWIEGK